ncbi:hypothetical protein GCM10009116_06220 [Brevundimonas basaltis]|uniref:Uncharacterized protein n=1 Tax=Brevundimonas basaltis TaxID=472166 RepID=A0A7W8I0F3_9CAUL|nr:hypothetical protein [Brevundimonas basaltis]MBB5293165.1 hypothetical protein [Brevundimonas basaltis]
MKRRRPSRIRINAIVIREVQRRRLVRIARGEIEPNCEREGFFQWSLLEGHRPRYADFILPPLLFLWEQGDGGDEADVPEDAPADAALSAS